MTLVQESVLSRLNEAFARTAQLFENLSAEDCSVRSMEDVSPLKWHLGHTPWFLEWFLLKPFSPFYESSFPNFHRVFNSYYEAVGTPLSKTHRSLLGRPYLTEILKYRESILDKTLTLLAHNPTPELHRRAELAIHHEQQHQELILMDLKHMIATSLFPPLQPQWKPELQEISPVTQEWVSVEGGDTWIGAAENTFAFDNEKPRHRQIMMPFHLSNRLVNNREYLEFINDNGYGRSELWLSDGWSWKKREMIQAPLYWEKNDGQWTTTNFWGTTPLILEEPVSHISFYEAYAFATWAGARLPTEFEFERAAQNFAPKKSSKGVFLENSSFTAKAPTMDRKAQGFFDLLGNLWIWTQSAYGPYPGFRPYDGEIAEYNGKFMVNQMILRGGSFATPSSHIRSSYRNFYGPDKRWCFSGLRLAKDNL